MLDISPEKILVVLLVALIVLGPGRLVEGARALGRLRAQWQRFSRELPPDTSKLIRDPRGALLDAVDEPRRAVADMAASTRRAMIPTTEQERGEGTR